MRESEFWTLMEQARVEVSDDRGFPLSSAIGAVLVERLARVPLERIAAFDVCRTRVVGRAHRWGLCAATFVVWKYVSDDTFTDFKAGLLGLGQAAFERVVAAPDALADVPVIQAIAAGRLDPLAINGGAIDAAAPEAYDLRTDDVDAFWDALQALPAEAWQEEPRTADGWSGGFGSPEDAERIPVELPRLHALFNPPTR